MKKLLLCLLLTTISCLDSINGTVYQKFTVPSYSCIEDSSLNSKSYYYFPEERAMKVLNDYDSRITTLYLSTSIIDEKPYEPGKAITCNFCVSKDVSSTDFRSKRRKYREIINPAQFELLSKTHLICTGRE